MYNPFPYNKKLIEGLFAKLPGYYRNTFGSITDLPQILPGGIIQTGKTRRVAKSFIYGNQILSLPQYLNKRFGEIGAEADPGKQLSRLRAFISSYKRDIFGVGDASKGMPVAHRLGFGAGAAISGSAIDIDLREKMANYPGMMPLSELHAHYAGRINQGFGFSGVTTKLYGNQEFTLPGRSIMPLLPGAGLAESATKFSTLADVEAIGGAAGPGTGGAVMRSSYTPSYMREVERVVASRTGGMPAGPERRAVQDQIRRSMFYNNIVARARVSTDPMMVGGAVKVRPGLLGSTFRWTNAELVFKKADLAASIGKMFGDQGDKKYSELMNIFNVRGSLSRKQMVAIKSAAEAGNLDFTALTAENYGLTEEDALRRLGKSVPKSARAQGIMQEGEDALRLMYWQKEAIQKVRFQNVKALADTAGLIAREPGIDALIPAINKSDVARSGAPYFDTLQEIMSQETGHVGNLLSKYQDIANAINEEMKAKGIASMHKARAMAPNAMFNRPWMMLPDQYAVSGSILGKMEGMISGTARQQLIAGTHPIMLNAMRMEDMNKSGNIIKIGLQEFGAMRSGGLNTMAHIIAERAGHGNLPQRYLDVMGFNLGSPSAQGLAGSSLTPEQMALMQTMEPAGGSFNSALVKGNALFDPNTASTQRSFMDLGESFKYGGRDVNKLALYNAQELQLAQTPGGDIWSNQLARAQFELIRSSGDREALGPAVTNFMEAQKSLLGKEGPLYSSVLKSKVGGGRGYLNFLHPEIEAELAQRFHEAPGQAYTLMSYGKAKEMLGVGWSKEEMMKRVMSSQGIMIANLRNPALQSTTGLISSRLAIIDEGLQKKLAEYGQMGHDSLYTSAAESVLRHGDRDGDIENIIAEFYDHERVQGELRSMRLKQADPAQRIFATEKAALAAKLEPSGSQYLNAKVIADAAGQKDTLEIGKQLAQKDIVASFFGNAALRAGEGALAQGLGQETATRIAQSFAAIQEAGGIDIKKTSALAGLDPVDLLFGGNKTRESVRKAKMAAILGEIKLDSIWGADAAKRRDLIASQMIGALDVGRSSTMLNDIIGLSTSDVPESYKQALRPYLPKEVLEARVPSGGIVDMFRNTGIVKPTIAPGFTGGVAGAAVQNEVLTQAAAEKAESRGAKFAEDTGSIVFDWAKGLQADLKEGKGWKSLLIGGAVLAGIGLSMRKPGNLTVISNSNRGEQTRPDGSYIKQQEAEMPTILPRNQSAARLMTDKQYNVMINMRDVRKQNASRKHMIDLGNMISGKYRQPAKVHVNINDDSRDLNYQQLFTNTYNRQMNLG